VSAASEGSVGSFAAELQSASARLVVFCADLNYSVRRNIVDLDEMRPGLQWLVMVHAPLRSPTRLLANQRINLRKHGWRWLPYQLHDVLARLASNKLPPAVAQAPGGEYEMDALRSRANVRVCTTTDIHAAASLDEVRRFAPDVGLSLAAPILKSALFALPRLGTINLHKGKLPEFRGMPPAFWELWTDQSSVGCSVHRVKEKLDQGELLAQATVPRERYSTQRGLQLRLDELGSELVCQVVQHLLRGQPKPVAQPSEAGKTYRKPTLKQQRELAVRLARLQPQTVPAWRRWTKDGIARVLFAWHGLIGWRLTAPRITVLLYHRVCDDSRDNLSVGVEQFERQMLLLRRHCTLLSIDEVASAERIVRSRRPLVAVSFDDGYRDNFLNAAPVLRRHRVPCAFYVSTGMVDAQGRFPHDVRRGNPLIPVMSWDELRLMHRWGFQIGSHTVSHIDCVAEAERVVVQELEKSRDALSTQLGIERLAFAYPYGGRHQMNAQRLALVRESGYGACLAAYGGSNLTKVDRWAIRRRGIHWQLGNACFLQQRLGY